MEKNNEASETSHSSGDGSVIFFPPEPNDTFHWKQILRLTLLFALSNQSSAEKGEGRRLEWHQWTVGEMKTLASKVYGRLCVL